MLKRILFFTIGGLFIASLSFSMTEEPDKKIILKGGGLYFPSNSVQVIMDKSNTLTTTFNKDVDNVTVTVKKKSGEIISVESMDAKEFDEIPVTIPNYKEGEYEIEISTPKGELEGSF